MSDVKELSINGTTYDIKSKTVVDKNNGSLAFWTGTQAQYDAITTHDSKTQYTTTDTNKIYLGDQEVGGSGGANKDLSNLSTTGEARFTAKADLADFQALQSATWSYSDGENLATKFASEIGTTNIWEWLHTRVSAGNYTGINIGDYIDAAIPAGTVLGMVNTSTVAAHTRRFKIVGIDLYTNTGDTTGGAVPHHLTIDAGNSTDTVKWNPSDYTCGRNASSADDGSNNPWLCSNLYACLNGVNNANGTTSGGSCANQGWLQLLTQVVPDAYIYNRRFYAGRKFPGYYDFTGEGPWIAMGKIFAPSEIEAYGCQIQSLSHLTSNTSGAYSGTTGTNYDGFGPYIQFPYYRSRGNKGILWPARATRWLSSVAGGSAAWACGVYTHGHATRRGASYGSGYAPLCFHFI